LNELISWKTEYCFNASSVPGPIIASIGNWWKTVVWGVRFKLLFSSIFSFFCLILFVVVFLIIFFFRFVLAFEIQLRTQTLFIFFVFKPWFYCSSFTQFGCSFFVVAWVFSFVEFISWLLFCFVFLFHSKLLFLGCERRGFLW